MEPRGADLVTRYKANYSIPAEAEITEQMILAHWNLERRLTQELLASSAENRWEVFDQCYTRLYAELEWLNRLVGLSDTTVSERHETWVTEIGSPPQRIYEVGSGTGTLIAYLAECGFESRGTEITRERGEKHLMSKTPNMTWGITDGVHLDHFERLASYDVVLSNNVIEHLHPADLHAHLTGVHAILTVNGRYIFNVPHSYTGPHDISRVFRCNEPKGVHLKEYTYRELVEAAERSGFSRVYYVVPVRFRKLLSCVGFTKREHVIAFGTLYLSLMLIVERALSVIPGHQLRRLCAEVQGNVSSSRWTTFS